MKFVSAPSAKQRFGALLKAAVREPVFIRRQNRGVSVILSLDEYKRIRGIKDSELGGILDCADDDKPR